MVAKYWYGHAIIRVFNWHQCVPIVQFWKEEKMNNRYQKLYIYFLRDGQVTVAIVESMKNWIELGPRSESWEFCCCCYCYCYEPCHFIITQVCMHCFDRRFIDGTLISDATVSMYQLGLHANTDSDGCHSEKAFHHFWYSTSFLGAMECL